MAKAQAIAQSFTVARERTLDATRLKIVEVAKARHAAVMETPPQPTSFTKYVDGVEGAPESDVSANGVIQYDYPRLPIVVMYALELLKEFSPVASGAYRDAHTIFLNGGAVTDLGDWRPGMEVMLANSRPYARKIEIGHMQMRVPGSSQVYERAVSGTNRRYGNLARALFAYRSLAGGSAKADRYPAIVFQER